MDLSFDASAARVDDKRTLQGVKKSSLQLNSTLLSSALLINETGLVEDTLSAATVQLASFVEHLAQIAWDKDSEIRSHELLANGGADFCHTFGRLVEQQQDEADLQGLRLVRESVQFMTNCVAGAEPPIEGFQRILDREQQAPTGAKTFALLALMMHSLITKPDASEMPLALAYLIFSVSEDTTYPNTTFDNALYSLSLSHVLPLLSKLTPKLTAVLDTRINLAGADFVRICRFLKYAEEDLIFYSSNACRFILAIEQYMRVISTPCEAGGCKREKEYREITALIGILTCKSTKFHLPWRRFDEKTSPSPTSMEKYKLLQEGNARVKDLLEGPADKYTVNTSPAELISAFDFVSAFLGYSHIHPRTISTWAANPSYFSGLPFAHLLNFALTLEILEKRQPDLLENFTQYASQRKNTEQLTVLLILKIIELRKGEFSFKRALESIENLRRAFIGTKSKFLVILKGCLDGLDVESPHSCNDLWRNEFLHLDVVSTSRCLPLFGRLTSSSREIERINSYLEDSHELCEAEGARSSTPADVNAVIEGVLEGFEAYVNMPTPLPLDAANVRTSVLTLFDLVKKLPQLTRCQVQAALQNMLKFTYATGDPDKELKEKLAQMSYYCAYIAEGDETTITSFAEVEEKATEFNPKRLMAQKETAAKFAQTQLTLATEKSAQVEELEGRITQFDLEQKRLQEEIAQLTEGQAQRKAKSETVKKSMVAELKSLQSKLKAEVEKTAAQMRIAEEQRVAREAVEQQMAALSGQITKLEDEIAAKVESIADLQSQPKVAPEEVMKLQEKIRTLEFRIVSLTEELKLSTIVNLRDSRIVEDLTCSLTFEFPEQPAIVTDHELRHPGLWEESKVIESLTRAKVSPERIQAVVARVHPLEDVFRLMRQHYNTPYLLRIEEPAVLEECTKEIPALAATVARKCGIRRCPIITSCCSMLQTEELHTLFEQLTTPLPCNELGATAALDRFTSVKTLLEQATKLVIASYSPTREGESRPIDQVIPGQRVTASHSHKLTQLVIMAAELLGARTQFKTQINAFRDADLDYLRYEYKPKKSARKGANILMYNLVTDFTNMRRLPPDEARGNREAWSNQMQTEILPLMTEMLTTARHLLEARVKTFAKRK